jgi:hypothetical protein
MAGGHSEQKVHVGKFEPSQRLKTLAFAFCAIGLAGFLVGVLKNQERFWPAYLTAFFFVTCLGVGGLFWASINHIAKAGWSTSVRRLAEGFTSFIPWTIAGSMLLLVGAKHLYPWTDANYIAGNYLVAAKTAYLNIPFMAFRLLLFGVGMWIFAKLIIGNSIKQDQSGDEKLTHKNVALSIGFALFFALSFSLFSVDLLMSLLPTWYSTIFGIYCFAGMFQSSLALFILILIYMKRNGFVSGYYTVEHIHDVAKFLKGFTVFWAYIAFSQFMLIWYANIPEETEFYLMRTMNGWMAISFGLLVFKFIVPFIALLPRWAKRTEAHLIAVCCLILVMQYVDIYWLVYPNFNDNHVVFGFYEIATLLGFIGLFMLTLMRFYSKHSLVAVKDPRLHEALNHHVTY